MPTINTNIKNPAVSSYEVRDEVIFEGEHIYEKMIRCPAIYLVVMMVGLE